MLDYHVVLTNDECKALEETFERMDANLAKRLTAPASKPHDRAALAYNAFRKLTKPLRTHLESIRQRRRGR